jgi:shikimate kinase
MTDEVSDPGAPFRNVVLTGFMGTGKSTVGRALAMRLGWRFVDTDDLICEEAGNDIPGIFGREGEARFREREREAIASLAGGVSLVVATGGGALSDPGNVEALRSLGPLVQLRARPETILRRVGNGGDRPLLAAARGRRARLERIRALLAERETTYASSDLAVDTDRTDPAEAALEVLREIEQLAQRPQHQSPRAGSRRKP